MDPRKSNQWGGDDDLSFVSSKGDARSKKKSVVMEEYGSIGMDLCEKPKAEEEKVVITGKKKGKKSCNKDMQHNDEDDSSEIFSEKISFSGNTKEGGSVNFALLDVEDDKEEAEDEDEVSPITLSSMKISNLLSTSFLEEEETETETSTCKPGDDVIADDEIQEIFFSGKKSVRKKGRNVELGGESMLGREVTGESNNDTNSATKSVEVGENSKSKKRKKNQNGRTAHEEDDFDKIFAEFGETPLSPVSKVENIQAQPEQVAPADDAGAKDGEEETIGSATAKKKKKKKDKKAAVSVATSSVEAKENKQENSTSEPSQPKKKDAKGKVVEKKVPKHVREMQDILARRQEAEQRRKKEEEEKLRKEGEERHMKEEQERVAEEIRQKRKMRKKERQQKKKQNGELLTAKQKTKAFRSEGFKNMALPDAGSLLVADRNGDSSNRRPIYGNNKKSARGKANDSVSVQGKDDVETKENYADEPTGTLHEMNSADDERIHIMESADTSEKYGAVDVTQENGNEKDEWDAKSVDSINFNINGDSDDKEEETRPVVKKELKDTATKAHDSGPVTDEPTVKARVAGKPTTAAKKTMPKVDDDTWPKDSSEKGEGSILNEIVEERKENLRSPIICIMGHVDTGKTKLLACIRGTNVHEAEAGGITQQIGATYIPAENILERTKELKADAKLKVPGLLVIDTPGHESFTNLRSRGSSLCDLAVLVVDITHDLEKQKQTIESLKLLRERNVEFIIALNKVDGIYDWKIKENAPIRKAMKQQSIDVVNRFNMRLTEVITQFKEQGLNTELYYKNREMGETFSIVPTSASSGEGIPDLLLLLVNWAQRTMVKKLTYVDTVQCTVLEVKVIEGHGTTIDVVLVNGVLHKDDQIVVCGSQGPIVTIIRALLLPHPMKKGKYLNPKEVKAAQVIKITAQGLEHAIAGTALNVIGPNEDVKEAKKTAMKDMESVMTRIDKSGEGVYVQASSLGSLEALLELLKSPDVKIPVSGIGIGPLHKKDIMKAGVMLERKKEYATILAFDVKVSAEARELADNMGVKIFWADIIYHLFDQFKSYIENIKEEKKKEAACEAVFPCVLKILPNYVYNKSDPIILGVKVIDGILKVGTPICILKRTKNVRVFMDIGRIASIENNNNPVDYAKKSLEVAIKIVASNPEEQKKFGKHFGIDDKLVSHISRRSIDILDTNYRDELSDDEWSLVLRLKKMFKIQ